MRSAGAAGRAVALAALFAAGCAQRSGSCACGGDPAQGAAAAGAVETAPARQTERASEPRAEPAGSAPSSGRASEASPAAPADTMDAGPAPPPLAEAVTVQARLDHASHEVPEGAPTVVAHAPAGLDPAAPLRLVVFLHGWQGCARVLAHRGPTRCREGDRPRTGWGLAAHHDAAGTGSVLVIPQLSWLARSGDPGRFAEPGFFAGFVGELLAGPLSEPLGGPRSLDDVDAVVLVAHSAGYETARVVVEQGGIDGALRAVVLMDALYDHAPVFARWTAAREGRKIVSLHTGRGDTLRQSTMLARALRGQLGAAAVAVDPPGPLEQAVAAHRVVVAESPHPHGAIPRKHLTELLRALASSSAPSNER